MQAFILDRSISYILLESRAPDKATMQSIRWRRGVIRLPSIDGEAYAGVSSQCMSILERCTAQRLSLVTLAGTAACGIFPQTESMPMEVSA